MYRNTGSAKNICCNTSSLFSTCINWLSNSWFLRQTREGVCCISFWPTQKTQFCCRYILYIWRYQTEYSTWSWWNTYKALRELQRSYVKAYPYMISVEEVPNLCFLYIRKTEPCRQIIGLSHWHRILSKYLRGW